MLLSFQLLTQKHLTKSLLEITQLHEYLLNNFPLNVCEC
jgi:hypothetical protein